MLRIGYARVSSSGQNMEEQLDKLRQAECDLIYQETCNSRAAKRPEFQACLNYLHQGDTLIITRFDRMARSVGHLSQLAKRFQNEGIGLVVLDQNIDSRQSTDGLLFNILASIDEFENDLRNERKVEEKVKEKDNNPRLAGSKKLNQHLCQKLYSRYTTGATIGQLSTEFKLSEATIFRAINLMKISS